MTDYDMCEQSYKNGYEKGFEKGLKSKKIRLKEFISILDNLGYRIVVNNNNEVLYDGEASLIKFVTIDYSKYFVDKINISENNSIFIFVNKE